MWFSTDFPFTGNGVYQALGLVYGFMMENRPNGVAVNNSLSLASRRRVISNPEYCFVHKVPKVRLGFNLAGIFTGFESCHNEG
jgi:hypothetical protein